MDKYERLKKRLQNREVILAQNWMTIDNPILVQKANEDPVDFAMFDCEHGVFDNERLIPSLQVCRLMGLPSIVRVPQYDYHLIARAMGFGADGIMLPRVETLEQVQAGIEGMFLPPIGRNGNGGHFQYRPGETMEEYQQNRFLMIQIESKKGKDLIPEMLKQYGDKIACFIIGPFDYSISMGIPRQFDNPVFQQEMQEVFDICKAHNKSVGIYCTDETVGKHYHAMGANILWMSTDDLMFMRGFHEIFEPLYALKEKD